MIENSCLYKGTVRHRRFFPRSHHFNYALYLWFIDLDELDSICELSPFISNEKQNFLSFHREDYHRPAIRGLKSAIYDTVERETGIKSEGPVRLLTQLRNFGYTFNPVSFYFVYNKDGDTLETIVAEITNTPWNERRAYILPVKPSSTGQYEFQFPKDFVVSPFFDLDFQYAWHFNSPRQNLAIHMENWKNHVKHFDATMILKREAIASSSIVKNLVHFPLMSVNVITAIYWQALKLWVKRVPFIGHGMTT